MKNYIDGFVFPVPRKYLEDYRKISETIAEIWKEHGASGYFEFIGDDLELVGTRSFLPVLDVAEDEAIVFGWVEFSSRETRDQANQRVPADPRMPDLINALTDPAKPIFDASRMLYGGFAALIQSEEA